MERVRGEIGFDHIAYGKNIDDERDFRPGQRAVFGVNYSFSSTTIIFPHRCLGFSVRAGSERSPVLPVGQHD